MGLGPWEPGTRMPSVCWDLSLMPCSLFQRKSWKRRFFALDDFTICYFKCEQVRSSPGALPGGQGRKRHVNNTPMKGDGGTHADFSGASVFSLSTLCAHLCSDITMAQASSLFCSELFCGQSHRASSQIFFSLDYFETLPDGQSGFSWPLRGASVSWSASWRYVDSLVYLSFCLCPQDREPLRTIFLKDVLKTRECLVKSG